MVMIEMSQTQVVSILVSLLFMAGLVHVIFWFLDIFALLYLVGLLNVDFPSPSLVPYIVLVLAVLLLLASVARIASGGKVRR